MGKKSKKQVLNIPIKAF